MKTTIILLQIVLLFILSSCSKDENKVIPDITELITFSFANANNPNLANDVKAVVIGNEITAIVPIGTDITALKASFTITGTTLKIGEIIQVSGISANDYSNPITYTLVEKDRSIQTYLVIVKFRNIVEPLVNLALGAEIIFAKKSLTNIDELYFADRNGGNVTQITFNGYHHGHFNVSPNHRKIVATRMDKGDTDGNGKITVEDYKSVIIYDIENNTEQRLFPQYDAGAGGLAWSGDGKYIYCSIEINQQRNIYRYSIDGTEMINITDNIGSALGISGKFVSDINCSNDGKLLTFLCKPSASNRCRITICNADGTGAKWVTNGGSYTVTGGWGNGDFDPDISNDNQFITFERATSNGITGQIPAMDVMKIKTDGTGEIKLSSSNNTFIDGIPSWANDNSILFTQWYGNATQITGSKVIIVDSDGSNYHAILDINAHHAQFIE
jgi:Tol biopolymer transport system component